MVNLRSRKWLRMSLPHIRSQSHASSSTDEKKTFVIAETQSDLLSDEKLVFVKLRLIMFKCRKRNQTSNVLPTQSSSSVLPTQSSFNVLPTQSSSNVLPTQSSSNVLPTQSSPNVLPTQSSSNVLPTQSSSNVLPTRNQTSNVLPRQGKIQLWNTENLERFQLFFQIN